AVYSGAEVVSVEPGSPADASSLRKGDLVSAGDDTPVDGAAALTGVVRGLEVGSTHELEAARDGAGQSVEITLGSRPTGGAGGAPAAQRPQDGPALRERPGMLRDRVRGRDEPTACVQNDRPLVDQVRHPQRDRPLPATGRVHPPHRRGVAAAVM